MSKELNTLNLTDQEWLYLQGREIGMTPPKACAYAQIKNTTQFLERSRKKEKFVAEERRIEETQREEMTMTREKVQKIVMNAIDMASTIGDPNAMIRGAAELNKMCGFYAPETKVIELNAHAQTIRASLESLDDGELLKLLERDETDVIDIDFEEVKEEVRQEIDDAE